MSQANSATEPTLALTYAHWPEAIDDGHLPVEIVFLVPFIIGAVAVAAMPIANTVVWAMGGICAAAFGVSALRTKMTFPPELFCFWAYVAWSTLGLINAPVPSLFWDKYFTMLQFCVFLAILMHYSSRTRTVHVMLVAIVVGVFVLTVPAYLSGEYKRAAEGETRAAGYALNSNTFGATVVYGMAILLYYFHRLRSWIVRIGIFFVVLAFIALVIASASRTALVSMIVLLLLWFGLFYTDAIRRRPLAILGGLIALAVVGIAVSQGLAGSLMAKRMDAVIHQGGRRDRSFYYRTQLYHQGARILKEHPVLGCGLGNFIVVSSIHRAPHSNYVDTFTATGIPGGLLYHTIWIVFGIRSYRLRRLAGAGSSVRALANLSLMVVLVRLVSDFAHMSYYAKPDWAIAAVMMGWSFYEERRQKRAQREAYAFVQDAPAHAAWDYSYAR